MQRRESKFGIRLPQSQQHYAAALAKARRPGVLANKRVRGVARNLQLPFVPPEDWHEPTRPQESLPRGGATAGQGLSAYPHAQRRPRAAGRVSRRQPWPTCEVVQFSRMTRKKQSFPCYGMQWGSSLYLYPIEENLIEYYHCPPTPNQVNEARMYGGTGRRMA